MHQWRPKGRSPSPHQPSLSAPVVQPKGEMWYQTQKKKKTGVMSHCSILWSFIPFHNTNVQTCGYRKNGTAADISISLAQRMNRVAITQPTYCNGSPWVKIMYGMQKESRFIFQVRTHSDGTIVLSHSLVISSNQNDYAFWESLICSESELCWELDFISQVYHWYIDLY